MEITSAAASKFLSQKNYNLVALNNVAQLA